MAVNTSRLTGAAIQAGTSIAKALIASKFANRQKEWDVAIARAKMDKESRDEADRRDFEITQQKQRALDTMGKMQEEQKLIAERQAKVTAATNQRNVEDNLTKLKGLYNINEKESAFFLKNGFLPDSAMRKPKAPTAGSDARVRMLAKSLVNNELEKNKTSAQTLSGLIKALNKQKEVVRLGGGTETVPELDLTQGLPPEFKTKVGYTGSNCGHVSG